MPARGRSLRADALATMLVVALVGVYFGSQSAAAQTAVFEKGDAVVTGFSGVTVPTTPSANPLDLSFINLDGVSAEILSVQPAGPPLGQLTPAGPVLQIHARDVGQVSAIALDDAPVPNIYVGATSIFGLQIVVPSAAGPQRSRLGAPGATWMPGQFGPAGGGPGSIYRIDGTTGAATLFATIGSNSGPGIGDIAYDAAHRQLFVSDLDTGLIERISADGTLLDSYDHGTTALPALGLVAVPDDGAVAQITSPSFNSEDPATWGYTPAARRVWGLAVHNGRLFYAVAAGPQIWSVGIASDGRLASDARVEIDGSVLPSPNAVAHVTFDGSGRIYLAQRGDQRGAYDYGAFVVPHTAAVARFSPDPANPLAWIPTPETYAVGMTPDYRDADGGVALGIGAGGTCDLLWSTGDGLMAGPAVVDGLQGNALDAVRPANVPPTQTYLVDYDGQAGDPAAVGHVGSVAVWCGSGTSVGSAAPPGGAAGIPPAPYPGSGGYDPIPGGYPPPGGVIVFIPIPGCIGTSCGSGTGTGCTGSSCSSGSGINVEKTGTGDCYPVDPTLGWPAGTQACPYTITLTNLDPAHPIMDSVAVTDTTVPGSTLVRDQSGDPGWTCGGTSPAGETTCTLAATPGKPTIPAGGHTELKVYTLLVPTAGTACDVQNLASVTVNGTTRTSSDTDPLPTGVPCATSTTPPPGTISITKTADGPCDGDSGKDKSCDFTITITNNDKNNAYTGPLSVDDTTVAAGNLMQNGMATDPQWNCPGAPHEMVCTLAPANIPAGGSIPLHVRVGIQHGDVAGMACTVKNTATVTWTDAAGMSQTASDDASANMTDENCVPPTDETSPPDSNGVSIEKKGDPSGCKTGFIASGAESAMCGYTVIVTNNGSMAQDVTIGDWTDTFNVEPDASNSASTPGWSCTNSTNQAQCTISQLPPGQSATLWVNVTVPIDKGNPDLESCRIVNNANIYSGNQVEIGTEVSGGTDLPAGTLNCTPVQEPPATLIDVMKTPGECTTDNSTDTLPVKCTYNVVVTFHDAFTGVLTVNDDDQTGTGLALAPDASWSGCSGPDTPALSCALPSATYAAGDKKTMTVTVTVPSDEATIMSGCVVPNKATAYATDASGMSTHADSDLVYDQLPLDQCTVAVSKPLSGTCAPGTGTMVNGVCSGALPLPPPVVVAPQGPVCDAGWSQVGNAANLPETWKRKTVTLNGISIECAQPGQGSLPIPNTLPKTDGKPLPKPRTHTLPKPTLKQCSNGKMIPVGQACPVPPVFKLPPLFPQQPPPKGNGNNSNGGTTSCPPGEYHDSDANPNHCAPLSTSPPTLDRSKVPRIFHKPPLNPPVEQPK